MKEVREERVLRGGSVAFEEYSTKQRRQFRSGFFSKPRKEATKEFYPDSPMELDKEVLEGKKLIVLDVE